jgi:hypothetical protein
MISGRKDCRTGAQRCEPTSEREALHCQLNHSDKDRHELALVMDGISPSALGQWGDPNGTSNIPSNRLEQLLRNTKDNAAYLRYLAALQNKVVHDVPEGVDVSQVADLCDDFGGLLRSIAARADGTTPDEAQEISKRGTELMEHISAQIVGAVRDAAGQKQSAVRKPFAVIAS